MNIESLAIGREKAAELYRRYREHQHYSTPVDEEIRRAYQLVAHGKTLIRVTDAIQAAGIGDEGLPKLAIARADAKECFLRAVNQPTRGAEFRMNSNWRRRENEHFSRALFVPWPGFELPSIKGRWVFSATPPLIPINLRPKRGIENYSVLWEAEWRRRVPVDPYLLRRIGRSDLWLVCAAWDLTEVEIAVLEGRIGLHRG